MTYTPVVLSALHEENNIGVYSNFFLVISWEKGYLGVNFLSHFLSCVMD